MQRERGDGFGLGHALTTAVRVTLESGDLSRARELAIECAAALEEHGAPPEDVAAARLSLADCEVRLCDVGSAADQLRAAITVLSGQGGEFMTAWCARVAATVALERDDPLTAAVLSAAFVALVARSGPSPRERPGLAAIAR